MRLKIPLYIHKENVILSPVCLLLLLRLNLVNRGPEQVTLVRYFRCA